MKSANRSKNESEKKKNDEAIKIQKILDELQGPKNFSNIKSAKKQIFIPKVKNKKGETINTRKGIANVVAEFYENLFEAEEGEEDKKEKKTKSRAEDNERMPDQFNHIPESTKKTRSKMLSTASRKVKQKTAVEYELNSSKIAVTGRRKNQKNLQRNLTTRKLLPEELAQNSYPGHLQER